MNIYEVIKIKVLQVNSVYGYASTGRTMKELSEKLYNEGHEPIGAFVKGNSEYRFFNFNNYMGIKTHALMSRVTGLQAYYSTRTTKRFLKFISEEKPDIIHLRNLHSNFINYNVLLEYIITNEIPLVLTLHDSWFYKFKNQDYGIDFEDVPESLMKENELKNLENKSWFFDRTDKIIADREKLYKQVQHLTVIGVSKWITNEAKNSILSSAKIIDNIYNWVNLDVFKPLDSNYYRQKLKLDNDFIILGVSSYWSNNKGYRYFVELSKVLPANMKIVLVGEVIEESPFADNIIHVGSTNNTEELAYYYSMADVFLNLSIAESFGKVSAEALACGTPVITNNYTANPEIVNEKTGIILENLSINSVLNSIEEVKEKGKDYYHNACVARANKLFNFNDNAKQYIKLYEKIIEETTHEKV